MADKRKTSDRKVPSGDETVDTSVIPPQESGSLPEEPNTSDAASGTGVDPVEPPSTKPEQPETASAEIAPPPEPEPDPVQAEVPLTDRSEEDPAGGNEAATAPPRDDEQPPTSLSSSSAQPAETVIIRKGGFLPMLLGGAVAAALGFGAAYTGALDDLPLPGLDQRSDTLTALTARLEAQDSTVTELSRRLTALEQAPAIESPEIADPTPILEDLATQIGVLASRIDALESRPVAEGAAESPQLQAALEEARAELEQIRQAVDAQRGEIAALTDAAAQEEEAAFLTARAAMQRAALSRVHTALDTGAPYQEALTDLVDSDLVVPDALIQQAEAGVVTLASLQARFPDLARDALRVARQGQGVSGWGGFLETQLGLRSLAPREGDDPDAVLSRAEAAVRAGAVDSALTELDALPERAAAIFADWRAQAEARLAALSAAQSLAQELNTN